MDRFQSILSQIFIEFWLDILVQMGSRVKDRGRLPREGRISEQRTRDEKRGRLSWILKKSGDII